MVILYRVIKNGVAHTEKCSCHRFNETNEYFMNVSFSCTNMKINIENFKIFVLVPFWTFTSNILEQALEINGPSTTTLN